MGIGDWWLGIAAKSSFTTGLNTNTFNICISCFKGLDFIHSEQRSIFLQCFPLKYRHNNSFCWVWRLLSDWASSKHNWSYILYVNDHIICWRQQTTWTSSTWCCFEKFLKEGWPLNKNSCRNKKYLTYLVY